MKKIAQLTSFFVSLLCIGACTPRPEERKGLDPRQTDEAREYYIVPMETVEVTRNGGTTTVISTGPLGDGCQKFAYLDSTRSGSILHLTFWASRPKAKDVICTMIMQYLNREVVADRSYNETVVHLPNGGEIRKPL